MKKLSLILTILLLLALALPAEKFAAAAGDRLISFTRKTMSGETINLDSVVGRKPVLLFFWATW